MNFIRRVPDETMTDESLFEATLDQLPHPVAVCEAADLHIVYANDQATGELRRLNPAIFEQTETAVGLSIADFFPDAVTASKELLSLDGAFHQKAITLIGQTVDFRIRKLFADPENNDRLVVTWTTIAGRSAVPWFEEPAVEWSALHARFAQFSLDEAADAVYWIGEDGSLAYFNEAACRMLGYLAEEMAGLTVMDIDPKCRPEDWAAAWRDMMPGYQHVYQWHQQAKDGRLVPVEISSNVMEFENHRYNVSFVRDITDRRRAENEIRDRETRLKQAQRIARLARFERDMKSGALAVEGIEEIFGVTGEALSERGAFMDMVPAEDRAALKAIMVDTIAAREPSYRTEYRVARPNGDTLVIEEHGEFSYEDSGEPLLLRGTIQDISERRKAEAQLEFTQFALDGAADAVFFLKRDSRVVYVNQAACDLLGYSRDELLTMTVCDFNPTLLPEMLEKNWHEVRRQHDEAGGRFAFETINQRKDGSFIDIKVSSRFIEYGGGRPSI